MDKQQPFMSRKEFLKKSSAAMVGAGLAAQDASALQNAGKKGNLPARRTLGRTGIRITPLGFGATRTMEPLLMRAVLDAGINFLDTGRSYFEGRNEIMVGEAVAGRRTEVVIQSKLALMIRDENIAGLTSQEIAQAKNAMTKSLEESLRALRTDYIDILLIHNATSPGLAHHDFVKEFFTSAKKAGKIRAYGFSSHTNQIAMLQEAIRQKFFEVIMVPYNHKGAYVHANSGRASSWDQSALEAELKKAMDMGIGLIAMKTCSGGPYPPPDGGRPGFPQGLRWILQRNRVHGMAVAIGNFEQLKENLQALS